MYNEKQSKSVRPAVIFSDIKNIIVRNKDYFEKKRMFVRDCGILNSKTEVSNEI